MFSGLSPSGPPICALMVRALASCLQRSACSRKYSVLSAVGWMCVHRQSAVCIKLLTLRAWRCGNGIDLSGIGTWVVKDRLPMRKPQTQNAPDQRQEKDERGLSWSPPAPLDVAAFGRRAGEIIARAARTMRECPRRERAKAAN